MARTVSGPQAAASGGEQLPLQLDVLGRRLDQQLAAGRARRARPASEPTARPPRLPPRSSARGEAPLASASRSRSTRRFERLRHGRRRAASRSRPAPRPGRSGPHRAGAEDADPGDPHRPSKSGSRFSRKACMPSTRSSVAIASSNSRRSASRPARERGLLGGEHRLLGEPARERRPRGDVAGQLQRRLQPAALLRRPC